MKKHLALMLVLALFGSAFLPQESAYSQRRGQNGPRYVEGEILVKIKQEAAAYVEAGRVGEEVLAGKRARAEAVVGGGSGQQHSGGLYLIRYEGAESVEEAVRQAEADPRVEYAEPNYLLFTQETRPNDQFFDRQWGLFNNGSDAGKAGADIGAVRAWDAATGSNDVVVAVIDTGVDLSHPDLAANAWVNPREVADNGVDEDGNGLVDDVNGWNFFANTNKVFESSSADFHGTHVAGTIGAVGNNGIGVSGVAWNVRLMSLKFISARSGETADAVKAIKYAINQKKSFDRGEGGANVMVINASWGGGGNSSSLRNAISDAGKAGILFIAAAGNGGDDGSGDNIDEAPDYPASFTSGINTMLSVASLNRSDTLSPSSNYGVLNVCVGAPGVQILSTVPGGGYGFLSGTSMAAPHVAGIAVLIWSREPSLTPVQVRDRIVRTAEPVVALLSKAVTPGRANALYASTNTLAPTPFVIGKIETNKKKVTVEGLGFKNGSTIVEVNGVTVSNLKYDGGSALVDGTLTEMSAKLGKSGINVTFPRGIPVTVTVFDTVGGQRSAPFTYMRPLE